MAKISGEKFNIIVSRHELQLEQDVVCRTLYRNERNGISWLL